MRECSTVGHLILKYENVPSDVAIVHAVLAGANGLSLSQRKRSGDASCAVVQLHLLAKADISEVMYQSCG